MKRSTAPIAALAVIAAAAACGRGDAIVAEPGDGNSFRVTEVIDAGGIRVGPLTFSEFRVTTVATGGAVGPNADSIEVSAVLNEGEHGLCFNGAWATAGSQSIDTTIGFKV